METRIALIGIIVENPDSVEQLNHLLHEYGCFIVGRMGIPYEKKNEMCIRDRSLKWSSWAIFALISLSFVIFVSLVIMCSLQKLSVIYD